MGEWGDGEMGEWGDGGIFLDFSFSIKTSDLASLYNTDATGLDMTPYCTR